MTTKYKTLITTAGAAKFAAATAGGTKITLTHMAVGDGCGTLPVPDVAQTALINEKWRAALNKISVDTKKQNYVVAELVIPPEVGGFWLREMGLYDTDGTLVAVANMAESYKPELAEGSGRAQTLRMVIIVSAIESVDLTIDATMVMATQDYVDDKLAEHERSRRHPDATLEAKGFTQLSNATDSESETQAATPKAVKAANDLADTANQNADKRLAKNGNLSDLQDKAKARDNLGLKGAAVLDTGTTAGTVAAGDDTRIVNALQKGNNLADVPDKAAARRNLGLKGAALLDVGNTAGTVAAGDDPRMVNAFPVTPAALSVNLNTLGHQTHRGVYFQELDANAKSELNYPIRQSGTLLVTPSAYGCQQEYTSFSTHRKFARGLTSTWNGKDGPWGPWSEYYGESHKPTAADAGAVPLLAEGIVNAVRRFQNVTSLFTAQSGSPLELGHLGGAPGNFYIDIHTDGTQDGVDYSHRLIFKAGGGVTVQTQAGGIVTLGDNGGDVVAGGSVTAGGVTSTGSVRAAGEVTAVGDLYSDRNISCSGLLQAGTAVYESGGRVRVYSSNNPPPPQDLSGYVTYGVADNRYVMDVARGGQALQNPGHTTDTIWEAPEGCYMTGLNIRGDMGDCRSMGKYYRATVVRTYSGGWRQIGSIA
jgi:hypothetical protein